MNRHLSVAAAKVNSKLLFRSPLFIGQQCRLLSVPAALEEKGINFNDSKTSFSSKTLSELVLSYGIFSLCTINPLVKNSQHLINLSYSVLGNTLTDSLVKKTFFAQFCGGENTNDLKPCIDMLNR